MKTVFVVGQHGNEKLPIEVAETLRSKVRVIVANPTAVEKNVRFLESDLNRSFPGNLAGKYEERLAVKLKKRLETSDEVVDFHTATCSTPLFAIVTKLTEKHIKLIRKLGVKRVVYMQNSIASGRALIDHVRVGVSIEAGRESTKSVRNRIEKVIRHYLSGKAISVKKLEVYSVFKILKKANKMKKLDRGIRNFKSTNLYGMNVYPILARERSYPEVLCLLSRKVNINSIIFGKD